MLIAGDSAPGARPQNTVPPRRLAAQHLSSSQRLSSVETDTPLPRAQVHGCDRYPKGQSIDVARR